MTTKDQYNNNPKKCLKCNEKISYEKRTNKFCSMSCSASFNNKGVRRHGNPPSNCLNCGGKCTSFRYKYCSIQCQQDYKYNNYIKRWLSGEERGWHSGIKSEVKLSHHIKRWIFESKGKKCEICKWAEKNPFSDKIPVQIHHVDGNSKNCSSKNLKILCPNCHSLTKNFGHNKYSKGKGRIGRYG